MSLEKFIQFENSFWELSVKAERLWKNIYERTFPGSQSHIVMLLNKNGPLKMSEVAEGLQMSAGAITVAADHLIEKNYIERQLDKYDRRIIRLVLTEHGQLTLDNLQKDGRQYMQTIFEHVSEEELNMMTAIFKEASQKI